MKNENEVQEALRRPFKESDIEWRVQQSGSTDKGCWAMVLAYIDNRAIMDRLDEVFGVYGWKNEFHPTPTLSGVMCGISVKMNGEWITKYDAAPETDIEATKGGISSSMKRTAVQFGIGRYLYNLEAGFAKVVEKGTDGAKFAKTKDNKTFYWTAPSLPNWALPITDEQIKEIDKLVEQKGADKDAMSKYFGFEDIRNATKQTGIDMIVLLSKKKDKEKDAN